MTQAGSERPRDEDRAMPWKRYAAAFVVGFLACQGTLTFGTRYQLLIRCVVGALWGLAVGLCALADRRRSRPVAVWIGVGAAIIIGVAAREDDTAQGLYVVTYVLCGVVFVLLSAVLVAIGEGRSAGPT